MPDGIETPNARAVTEDGARYATIGDHLKVRVVAERGEKGWLGFGPQCVSIELNGQPLTTCQKIEMSIDRDGFPLATLTLALDSIDIDADTLTALKVFLKHQEEATEDA